MAEKKPRSRGSRGVVVWFNKQKGYGFTRSNSGDNLFVISLKIEPGGLVMMLRGGGGNKFIFDLN